MFENLTYKLMFLELLAITVLLGLAAYKRSFKLAIDAHNEYYELSERLNEINCYRGKRHRNNLPVRGQLTKTNAHSRRKAKK